MMSAGDVNIQAGWCGSIRLHKDIRYK